MRVRSWQEGPAWAPVLLPLHIVRNRDTHTLCGILLKLYNYRETRDLELVDCEACLAAFAAAALINEGKHYSEWEL